ncbi:MAG: type II secretion system protein GspJ [Kofleriaceae bacterium]
MRAPRRREAGMTLIEIMIATAIMAAMMMLAWRTIQNTSTARYTFEDSEARNHELRMALARIVTDFEAAYLSKNEDPNATNPRTMMIARPTSKTPEIRFSTLGHRVLWADANESEQTVISYVVRNAKESDDGDKKGGQDLVRREQRRQSNLQWEEEPAEYDVLVHDIGSLKVEFWNWKNLEWQDTWDTTQVDGQKGWLPTRVRVTVTIQGANGKDYKLTSQARILMQEPLVFLP